MDSIRYDADTSKVIVAPKNTLQNLDYQVTVYRGNTLMDILNDDNQKKIDNDCNSQDDYLKNQLNLNIDGYTKVMDDIDNLVNKHTSFNKKDSIN